ncbi:MAG: hypothetical protein AVDCRST_MAG45-90 [uncultured Solirubrobacterales bacterium]|uniref:Uncharacterized protein n=1 Tax=uncultured Solirubrobacterales bacterium TaxID=768556 RepID=A0A6J4RRG0_9ACTN|nr:MAG: hypothetical protein AVDCRST_MAG45-90 [uncultured Solirubrobacterales bacterium]
MAAVPLLVSLALALAICPLVVRTLWRHGWTRANHRGARVAHPAGIGALVSALVALLVLSAFELAAGVGVLGVDTVAATCFVAAVALLGLADDLWGDREGAPRGLRRHARALVRGRPSTGAAKAVGTAALAVVVLTVLGFTGAELALAACVLTLATHGSNLLDLRPGRSTKALLALLSALTLGTLNLEPFTTLGLVLPPILVLLVPDLRERAMLGDTGAGAIGALAGLWLVLTLPMLGQAVALGLLAALAVYGELRSISVLVEQRPLLRRIDSLGRIHA